MTLLSVNIKFTCRLDVRLICHYKYLPTYVHVPTTSPSSHPVCAVLARADQQEVTDAGQGEGHQGGNQSLLHEPGTYHPAAPQQ